MRLNVFVTHDPESDSTAPVLFLPARSDAFLPPHPRSLEWKYMATIDETDGLLTVDREAARAAIAATGHYIANRLI